MTDLATKFMELFINRPTRVGLSEPSLTGKERSVVTEPSEIHGLLSNHLFEQQSHGVGAYAASEQGFSKWGCYDFDAKTSDPAADASYASQALARAGLTGIVEISRSGEGRHVWVFLDEPVAADDLRKCLRLVDSAAGLECGEINPKQRVGTDHSKNLGNYVRLPYHARWVDEQRMVCLNAVGKPMSLEMFVRQAYANLTPATRVVELAGRYHEEPPPRRHIPVKGARTAGKRIITDAHLIMRGDMVTHEGGLHDGRNNKLFTFANYVAQHPAYRHDIDSALGLMERVWREQLDQHPDFIGLDVCLSMIRRAFDNYQMKETNHENLP